MCVVKHQRGAGRFCTSGFRVTLRRSGIVSLTCLDSSFQHQFQGNLWKPISYDASHRSFQIHLSFLYLWFLLMLKVQMERRLISFFISCRLVSVSSSHCPSPRSYVEDKEAHFMTNTYTLKLNCCVCYVQVTSCSPICFCLEMID